MLLRSPIIGVVVVEYESNAFRSGKSYMEIKKTYNYSVLSFFLLKNKENHFLTVKVFFFLFGGGAANCGVDWYVEPVAAVVAGDIFRLIDSSSESISS